MASTSTYLNFMGDTEAAFAFYRSVFGTEYRGGIARMGDMPPGPGMPTLSDAERTMIMHIELPILGGHVLMGTDALPSMGHTVVFGTNFSLNLEPDTRAEADRLFRALSEGGKVTTPLQEMFWGYFGTLVDRFGVQWMMNCRAN
ncbi:MAG: VOC family protein [Myxococcota bacterium]